MDTGNENLGAVSKSVLVLGGASPGGIGAAVCERLQRLGHMAFAPAEALLNVLDDYEDGYFTEALSECEPDCVVYSVGVNELDWSWALTRGSFERLMSVNVWGFINLLKALQITGKSYSVLAVTSDAATRPMRTSMAYCASKAALNMVIKVASRELASEGWRINGLAPGKVDGTPMTKYVDKRVLELRGWTSDFAEEYELSSAPIGRKLWPAEVAAAACDILLSDSIGWTGDIITVNGGR
jgi:NAD(P)-dependent dehydrogenase (short-subunit alcohol dehydrogenase family)